MEAVHRVHGVLLGPAAALALERRDAAVAAHVEGHVVDGQAEPPRGLLRLGQVEPLLDREAVAVPLKAEAAHAVAPEGRAVAPAEELAVDLDLPLLLLERRRQRDGVRVPAELEVPLEHDLRRRHDAALLGHAQRHARAGRLLLLRFRHRSRR